MENSQKLSLPTAIIIAGALVAVGLYFGLASRSPATVAGPNAGTPPSVNIKDVKIAGEPYIGNADAPVVMAYWSDYQCPYCKSVEVGGVPQIPTTPAIPSLIKDYVDTGKLKIVFKDFQFLGADSITAALYERAVWELYPDKFYTWRSAIFKAQDQEGDQGFGNEDSILDLTGTIPGMDASKLKALVTQNRDGYTKAIDADREEGSRFGIQGTPAFIIGTKLIAGAEQLPAFKAAIDAQLIKK